MSKENGMQNLIHLSFGEELGNSIAHGVMSILLLFLLPVVAIYSYNKGGILLAAGTSVFVISIFLMFLTSTLYHAMSYDTPHKYVLRILDHIFIYFAIAGSYTPIALYAIGGWQGWLILIIQWSMVLFGILYKSIAQKSIPKLSVLIYLMMGWTAVFFFPTLIHNTTPLFIGLIILGGLLYTVGAFFYMQKSRPYFHFVWHVFINLAALTHFIAIVFFL
ncbi:MAG: hemolysin III family protein [Erysipelotrichaceae bacterium]